MLEEKVASQISGKKQHTLNQFYTQPATNPHHALCHELLPWFPWFQAEVAEIVQTFPEPNPEGLRPLRLYRAFSSQWEPKKWMLLNAVSERLGKVLNFILGRVGPSVISVISTQQSLDVEIARLVSELVPTARAARL